MTRPQTRPPGALTGNRAAIEVRGLRKSFDDHTVLDGVDLTVAEGSVMSLLGPNGAGKTTMVKILATLATADSGEVKVAGFDVAKQADHVRSAIGVTGQFSAVDIYQSAQENLMLMADLWHLPKKRGRQRTDELLEIFDLVEASKKPVGTFSGGMKRRLDLAMTLVGSPRIIFLDEPTTGLDPRGRLTMWEAIRDLVRHQAVTIFLTTQYLEEANELADHVVLIDHGRVVVEGTPAELKSQVPGGHILLTFATSQAMAAAAGHLDTTATGDEENLTLQIPSDGSALSVQAVLNRIDSQTVSHISLHTPNLDDVFLTLTGSGAKKDKS
jgi:ABC-2 type transport system ATP-binding protein